MNKKYFVFQGTKFEEIKKNNNGSKSSVLCPKY